MIVADLVARLEPILAGAADWDPVGLQLGDLEAAAIAIGVCHEVNDAVVTKARDLDLLVSYHPLLFAPTTRIVAGPTPAGRAHALIASGTALVVVHTGWDAARGGTADALAATLGLRDVEPFGSADERPDAPLIGRVGTVTPTTVGAVADTAADRLAAPAVRVGGDRSRLVERVAVLPGSGSAFLAAAATVGADVVVTGDVSHHRAVAALDAGVAVIDVGHGPSERPGMATLLSELADLDPVDLTDVITSPWEGR